MSNTTPEKQLNKLPETKMEDIAPYVLHLAEYDDYLVKVLFAYEKEEITLPDVYANIVRYLHEYRVELYKKNVELTDTLKVIAEKEKARQSKVSIQGINGKKLNG